MEAPVPNSPPDRPAPGPGLPGKSGITEIFGTLLIVGGILIFLALASFQSQLSTTGEAPLPQSNMIGTVGYYSASLLFYLFGKSAFLLGPYLFLLGFLTFYRGGFSDPLSRVVAVVVVMAGSSLLGALLYEVDGRPSEAAGGLLGSRVGQAFQILFGYYGGLILALGLFLAGVFLAIRVPVPVFLGRLHHRIVAGLRSYSTALGNPGGVGYREAYHAAGAGAPPGGNFAGNLSSPEGRPAAPGAPFSQAAEDVMQRPEFIRKETAERRPWVERVRVAETSDPPAPGKAPEDVLYNDFPAESESELRPDAGASADARGDDGRIRVSPNARYLQEALERMLAADGNDRPWLRAGRVDEPRRAEPNRTRQSVRKTGGRESGGRELAGYFNADESRFHFRTGPQVRTRTTSPVLTRPDPRSRPAARTPEPGARADASLLRPIALDLLLNRQARRSRAPEASHALAEIDAMTGDELEQPATAAEIRNARKHAGDFDDEPRAAAAAELDDEPLAVEAVEFDDETLTAEAVELDDELQVAETVELDDEDGIDDEDGVTDGGADGNEVHAGAEADSARGNGATPDEFALAAPRRAQPRPRTPPVSGVPRFSIKAGRRYHLPGNILQPAERPAREDVSREIAVTRERLEKVMQDYGIQARVVHTQRGPIITLYEVKLEPGVRVSRILGISDEIKMNLEAPSVRIIAPIPGKPTVGIEIPNRNREGVVLGDMLDRESMARKELCVVLGKNIAGEKQYVDLARLPHLLIAGSTGSGKSVYMNAIIASLLYTRSPEDVRFIMIDPKMVELKLYDGIPHLIMPVITDVRLASKALTWVIGEMERRYEILSHLKCRDIRSYNDRVAAETRLPGFERPDGTRMEKMPYIVLFIDELSDLMMVAAKDVEDSIIRLTQKARAVGIHVVMATQRPSVDVITALIKANCPARIAFHVAQKTDSRTILDMNGAETLLGKGDMLYRSPSSTALIRLQAPLLTEEEIESVVQETGRFGEPVYVDLEAYADEEDGEAGEGDVDAELLAQAWKIVLESGKTSTSYIQRRLRIGYNRAASLIEMLEHKGYLSPAIGNKPREILKRS